MTLVTMPYFTSVCTTLFSLDNYYMPAHELIAMNSITGGSPEVNREKKEKKLRKREIYLKYRENMVA